MEQKTKNNIEMDEDGFIKTQPRQRAKCNIRSCKVCNESYVPKKNYKAQGKGHSNYTNNNSNNSHTHYRPAKKYCFNNCDYCQMVMNYLDKKVEEFHDDGYFTVFFK